MKIHFSNDQGFTLIELLVVISIIGLLSSIVVATLKSATTSGSLAAGREFATHTRSAFADDAIGFFEFDDSNNLGKNTGVTFVAGTIGSSAVYAPDTSLKDRGGLLLNNSSNGILGMTWDDPAVATAITSHNYTFSLWYRPNTPTCASGFATPIVGYCLAIGDQNSAHTGISVRPGNGGIDSVVGFAWDSTAGVVRTVTSTVNIKNGQWVHLALGVSGTKMVLYINGKAINTATAVGPNGVYLAPLFLGSVCCTNGAWGYFDDVAIYSRALIATEVEQIYAMGLPSHRLALKDEDGEEE